MARKRKYKLPRGLTILKHRLYIKCYPNGSDKPPYIKCFGYYSIGRPSEEQIKAKQAAEDELAEIMNKKRRGTWNTTEPDELLLSECRDKFLASKPDTRTKTEYGRSINKFINLMGDIKIHEIKPSHIREYRTRRETAIAHLSTCNKGGKCSCTKPVKKSTVNRELTALQACLSWITFETRSNELNYKVPQFNPVSYVPKPSEIEFRRKRILSREELIKLKEACKDDPKMWDIIKVTLTLGLRFADLQTLQNNDSVSGIQKKTGREFNFGAVEGITLPLDFTNFFKRLKEVKRRANLEHWQFRDLRRTAAYHAKEGGMSLEHVQDFLGHGSSKTTTIYLNVPSPRAIEAALNNRRLVDGL